MLGPWDTGLVTSSCLTLAKSDDTKKDLEHNIEDMETVIADAEETTATLKSEIEDLEESFKALGKDVATQTCSAERRSRCFGFIALLFTYHEA